jgi:MFS family permease
MMKSSQKESVTKQNPFSVLKHTFKSNGKNILIAVLGISSLMVLRISRNVLLPLWAESISVDTAVLGILVSIGALVETAMVVPVGNLLDTRGRKWAVVPCTLGFALAMAFMPLAGNVYLLALVVLGIALFNGLGSGINMTISADLAPRDAAGEFIGIWRFITDIGMFFGPALAGVIAAGFGLSIAPLAMAAIGLGGGFLMLFKFQDTSGLVAASGKNSINEKASKSAMQ